MIINTLKQEIFTKYKQACMLVPLAKTDKYKPNIYKEMSVTTFVMEAYETLKVEMIEVEVEKGFASSAEPLGEEYEEIEW